MRGLGPREPAVSLHHAPALGPGHASADPSLRRVPHFFVERLMGKNNTKRENKKKSRKTKNKKRSGETPSICIINKTRRRISLLCLRSMMDLVDTGSLSPRRTRPRLGRVSRRDREQTERGKQEANKKSSDNSHRRGINDVPATLNGAEPFTISKQSPMKRSLIFICFTSAGRERSGDL